MSFDDAPLASKSFANCPLVEIVHLHDCIRGELNTLLDRVKRLRHGVATRDPNSLIESKAHADLELQIRSQFQLLLAVFKAHSTAEDETIWPALRLKTESMQAGGDAIEEQEYAEDHADEERRLNAMHETFEKLNQLADDAPERLDLLGMLEDRTTEAVNYFYEHLQKEETSALPLIQKLFSLNEMKSLVGDIMGKRPAGLMREILDMMIRNLDPEEQQNMLHNMRSAVEGTYFEKWLSFGGFKWPKLPNGGTTGSDVTNASMLDSDNNEDVSSGEMDEDASGSCESGVRVPLTCYSSPSTGEGVKKCAIDKIYMKVVGETSRTWSQKPTQMCGVCETIGPCHENQPMDAAQYEKFARAIAKLKASGKVKVDVSLLLQRIKNHQWDIVSRRGQGATASSAKQEKIGVRAVAGASPTTPSTSLKQRGSHLPPALDLCRRRKADTLPHFSAVELAPTYNTGTKGRVLGCPHYSRGCKIRAPCCNRLYSCRLCHDLAENRPCEKSTMDMYSVKEMLCMYCCTLQPVGRSCQSSICAQKSDGPDSPVQQQQGGEEAGGSAGRWNDRRGDGPRETFSMKASYTRLPSKRKRGESPELKHRKESGGEAGSAAGDKSGGRVLGRYYCSVCKLWDNSSDRSVYHCPYCNVCRVGQGLGIDYRHCMACNCCVELRPGVKHQCISQAIEGKCPICFECLRFTTQPLKGLPCGHVLHLGCYKQWRALGYTCPVCVKSMDDMSEYFSRLDQARAVTVDPNFVNTRSRILCNDCSLISIVQYEMFYHKCPKAACGSYNTRVLETIVVRPGSALPDNS